MRIVLNSAAMDSDVAESKKSGKKLQVPLWLENADESCGPMDCPNPPRGRVVLAQ